MALATKEDAVRELKLAEDNMLNFLSSVEREGNYIPLNKVETNSAQKEWTNFKQADWQGKANLMQKYRSTYKNSSLTPAQKDLLDKANMSVLIGKFVNMGIPTQIAREKKPEIKAEKPVEQSVSSKAEALPTKEKNYYNETMQYIAKMRAMKNFDKCEYKGQPLSNVLSKVQFRRNQTCSEREFNFVKASYESLERYNDALKIISELETKVFPPTYRKEFAYQIAQTVKNSKGICTENQYSRLLEARNRLVSKDIEQIDMFSFMHQNGFKQQNLFDMDR